MIAAPGWVASGDQSGVPPTMPARLVRSTGSEQSAFTDQTPPDVPDSSSTRSSSLLPSELQFGWYSNPGMSVIRLGVYSPLSIASIAPLGVKVFAMLWNATSRVVGV